MSFLFLLKTSSFTHKLSDLFEMKQGLAVDTTQTKKGENKYKVVYPSRLNNPFKTLDIMELSDYYTSSKLSEDKLLSKMDYIIAAKGLIKGFSMYHSEECLKAVKKEDALGIIGTNHLIILSPKPQTLETFSSSYFLHNLLDQVVNKIIKIKNSNKNTKQNYLTIGELKDIEIEFKWIRPDLNDEKTDSQKLDHFKEHYSLKLKSFNNLYMDWENKLAKFKKADQTLSEFNEKLKEEVIISFPIKS